MLEHSPSMVVITFTPQIVVSIKPAILCVDTLIHLKALHCSTIPRWLLLSCMHFLDQPISNILSTTYQ
jgi:hypothetical protein